MKKPADELCRGTKCRMREFKIVNKITNRNEDMLGRYLHDISSYELITNVEEEDLARQIKLGNKAAEHRLVTANLRFVVSCAKKYQNMGMNLTDLISEGNLGLIKAAGLFDQTRGFKFISYAVWWIRQAMLNALNENLRVVRIPMNKQNDLGEINKIARKLEQVLEREPTIAELAEEIGKTEAHVADVILVNDRGTYLDDIMPGASESNNLMDYLHNPDGHGTEGWVNEEDLDYQAKFFLNTLSERDRKLIIHLFGLFGAPILEPEDVGVLLNLSAERVRQLKTKAIKKMRESRVFLQSGPAFFY